MTNKDRFSEIVFAIDLLPDTREGLHDLGADGVIIPDGTSGLSDRWLALALVTQSLHAEDELWKFKLYTALMNTAMDSIMRKGKAEDDDLWTFALCANIAWANGEAQSTMRAFGLLAHTLDHMGGDMPEIAVFPLENPEIASNLKEQDPYSFLD
jgi:hypothetical protein